MAFKRDKSGCVYIICESTREDEIPTNYYKIGNTEKPDIRIINLRTGNPRNLEYICKIKVSRKLSAEKEAHKKLEDYLVEDHPKGGKEWYYVTKGKFKSFRSAFKESVKDYEIEE